MKSRKTLIMLLMLLFCAGAVMIPAKDVSAKKVNNCTILGTSYKSLAGGNLGYFKKITFSGNKVTIKGNFKVKINGKKKKVNKITLKVASSCKYVEVDEEEFRLSKSTARKEMKKGQYIYLDVKIKNGKVTKFIFHV